MKGVGFLHTAAAAMASLLSGGRTIRDVISSNAALNNAYQTPNSSRVQSRKAMRQLTQRFFKGSNSKNFPHQGYREKLRRRMGGFHKQRRMIAQGFTWNDHEGRFVHVTEK